MYGFDYKLEHLCSYNATLSPEVIGPVADGLRVNYHVTGGTVTGPKLNGTVRPVGADWLVIRTDGVGILDVRATMETDDGALVYVTYNGVADLGENGYQDALNQTGPATIKIHAAPRCATAHPAYQWLNRAQCLLIGEFDAAAMEVRYDMSAVR
jgi:Protein of unknown function (DUF3237)